MVESRRNIGEETFPSVCELAFLKVLNITTGVLHTLLVGP